MDWEEIDQHVYLGLKRGTIRHVSQQAAWAACFRQSKALLVDAIGEFVLDIQHIGSTSIQGIMAKPILDIGLAVEDWTNLPQIHTALIEASFIYRGDQGDFGGQLYVKDIAPEVRSHHIHIVLANDPQWKNYLFFRDELNRKPSLAKAYEALKQQLAILHVNDRPAYTKGKHDFIRSILARLK